MYATAARDDSKEIGKQGQLDNEEEKEKEKEKEEKKEKIPHMCESIGHRPLRGRCPASSSTSSTTYLGRARVPLTI